MKIIYLNYNKLCHSCFLMGFVDSKFKFNLYHKHFPEALEKYPVLLSLLSFSILVMYVLIYAFMYVLRLYAAKFAAAFYGALVSAAR